MTTRVTASSSYFPQDELRGTVSDNGAVPETYRERHERYCSIGGLFSLHKLCTILRDVQPHQCICIMVVRLEKSTQFILVLHLVSGHELRMSWYVETGLQSSPQPEGFLDPCNDIDRCGLLGDPFTLSVLSPWNHEDGRVFTVHMNS